MIFLRFPGGLSRALTFSYDDGVEQDAELIRILDSHGMKGTFNVNSGLFAQEGTVYPAGQVHRRMTEKAAKTLYAASGHEVAVHCLTHASLPELSAGEQVYEVMCDRKKLETMFDTIVDGMAYPFGTYDDAVVNMLRTCGIRYARTVESSHSFSIPRDWLRLKPTCHHDDPQLMALADKFLNSKKNFESKLFYLWGHAFEFEANDNWQVIRDFTAKLADRSDTWYATNIEICAYVQDWKQVYTSADGHIMYNPTARKFWFDRDNVPCTIESGETIRFR